jgi:glycosyltransferase involved in cell wall biosynthesis
MNICSILTSLTSGGAETLVCNLARHFREAGHRCTVLTLVDAPTVDNPADVERLMAARLRAAGISFESLALSRRRGILRGALALHRALARVNPDIVHVHTARAAVMLALIRPRAPVILTHHNSRLGFSPATFQLLNSVVDTYVAISEECRSIFSGHTRRPIRLILNGASADLRSGGPRLGVADSPRIVAVGMLSEQKDYATLIRAARALSARLAPKALGPRIRIIGGGTMEAGLQQLIDEEDVSGIVELAGVRTDVEDQLRQADLFVNSSAYEGMPIALIEAMMKALPIVATDVAGNRELVTDGLNGLLVPSGDAPALGSAIARLIEEPELYRSMSKASWERSADYTSQRCAQKHLELYADLAGKRAGPPLEPELAPAA